MGHREPYGGEREKAMNTNSVLKLIHA